MRWCGSKWMDFGSSVLLTTGSAFDTGANSVDEAADRGLAPKRPLAPHVRPPLSEAQPPLLQTHKALARPSSAGRPWDLWAIPRSPPRWGIPDRARFTSTHAMGRRFLSLSWNERPRSKLTMGSLMIHKKWPRCPRRKSFEIMRKSAVSKPSNAARSWTRIIGLSWPTNG